MGTEAAEALKSAPAASNEVWGELERVCRSAAFSRSLRLQQFLRSANAR